MAAPTLLLNLRNLKTEEKKISDILAILKSQLTKLKVEELALNSKIRDSKVKETVENFMQSLNEDIAEKILPDSEEVNRQTLNLTTSNELLEKLASGGGALLKNQFQEEEEEELDDDDEEDDEAVSKNDILTNFLA